MFEGQQLIVFTDHKPLVHAFKKLDTNKEIPRRTRQLLFISKFTTDIRFVEGKNNIVADTLSRLEVISCPTFIDYDELAEAQAHDAYLARTSTAPSGQHSNSAVKPTHERSFDLLRNYNGSRQALSTG